VRLSIICFFVATCAFGHECLRAEQEVFDEVKIKDALWDFSVLDRQRLLRIETIGPSGFEVQLLTFTGQDLDASAVRGIGLDFLWDDRVIRRSEQSADEEIIFLDGNGRVSRRRRVQNNAGYEACGGRMFKPQFALSGTFCVGDRIVRVNPDSGVVSVFAQSAWIDAGVLLGKARYDSIFGGRVLVLESLDRAIGERLGELGVTFIVGPGFWISELSCGLRYCWALGTDGEVAVAEIRNHGAWRVVARVDKREVVSAKIDGDDVAFLGCRGRLFRLSALPRSR